MIRITKQTDYGIVLLTHLAVTPERLERTSGNSICEKIRKFACPEPC